MKITLQPDFPTLAAYAKFVEFQPRSHAFTSWIKSLASNFSIDPATVQVTFVPVSTEQGRDDANRMLAKVTNIVERAPELQEDFAKLADQVAAANDTEELLALLPALQDLSGRAAAYPRAIGGVAVA